MDRYAFVLSLAPNSDQLLASLVLRALVTCGPSSPAFTNVGLLDFIIELIIREDEVAEFIYYCTLRILTSNVLTWTGIPFS